jgi:hypothetical protein
VVEFYRSQFYFNLCNVFSTFQAEVHSAKEKKSVGEIQKEDKTPDYQMTSSLAHAMVTCFWRRFCFYSFVVAIEEFAIKYVLLYMPFPLHHMCILLPGYLSAS